MAAGAALALALAGTVACGTRVERVPVPTSPPASVASPTTVEVPRLVGLPRVDAVRRVLALGLHVEVVPLGAPRGKPRDEVARQVPLPGTPLDLGSAVTVAAWCRPRPCPSPPAGQSIYDPCSCATRG